MENFKKLLLNAALAGFAAGLGAVAAGGELTVVGVIAAGYAAIRVAAGYIAARLGTPIAVDK
jgi:hypothetical protein